VASLATDLESLARIGADDSGVTRFPWSPELAAANEWLVSRLEELGFEAAVDPAGNVVGKWHAGEGKAIAVGSHLDTVPRGGRFDGALGVLSGLAALRILKAEAFEPRQPLWLVSFNDEEGVRFGTGFLGSRSFLGDLRLEEWHRRGVREAMADAGFEFDRLADARAIDELGAYLELHIEQGPVLEQAGVDVGVVTGITGLLSLRVRLRGEANHAGTTPMAMRRDALVGAARIAVALRDEARSREDMTANVGRISVEPGGANVVPGLAEFTVDVRSPTAAGFAAAAAFAYSTIDEVAKEEWLEQEIEELHRLEPVPLDDELQGVLVRAASVEGASHLSMPSGAGHDAMILARHVPAAMLFVPSRGGVSHSPDEYTPPEQCELGARVLARALALLAGEDYPRLR
jgi:allantoate deiminase